VPKTFTSGTYNLSTPILLEELMSIMYSNSYCEGGHGLSIGSLGKGGQVADVENVLWVSRSSIMIHERYSDMGLHM
jgi:hypothetical protein